MSLLERTVPAELEDQVDSPEPVATRPAGRRAPILGKVPVVSVLSVLLGLALWEVIARLELVDPLVLPRLSETVRRLGNDLFREHLLRDLVATAVPFLVGTLLSVLLGSAIGAAMGASRWLDRVLGPWVLGLNAVPRIAFVSVFIVAFGLGMTSKVAVVTATAILPMVLTMRSGVRSLDREIMEMAASFRAPRGLILRRIVLPATTTYFVAGFRITVALALIGEVVAEFFSSSSGIGFRLQAASQTYDINEVYAMVLVLAVAGICSAQMVAFLERRVARWQGTTQS